MSRKANVISLSLAQVLLVLSSLILGMVFTRILSKRDYGTYLQTFLAYDFAVPLLTLGLPTALYYFLANNNKNSEKRLVLEVLTLLFVAGLIFSSFLILGGINLLAIRFENEEIKYTLKWLVFYPLYTLPLLAASSVWISKGEARINAIYNVVTGILTTSGIIVSVLIFRNYEVPIIVRVFMPLVYFPICLYLLFKNLSGKFELPRLSSMNKILKLSIPLGLASIFGSLATQLASLIVSLLTTPEAFATYSIGAKEVPLIGVITGSISVVIMAEMANKIKNNSLTDALALFKKASLISSFFLFPIMCFLMFNAEAFMKILYSEKYINSAVPFRIYLLAIPIRIAYYGSAFIAFGKTKQILIRSIFDLLLTGAFCYLLVYYLGENGAAFGLILTMFIWTVPFNLYTLSKYFKTNFFNMLPFIDLLKVLFISVFCALLSSILKFLKLNFFLEFITSSCAFLILYISILMKANIYFKLMIINYKNKLFK